MLCTCGTCVRALSRPCASGVGQLLRVHHSFSDPPGVCGFVCVGSRLAYRIQPCVDVDVALGLVHREWARVWCRVHCDCYGRNHWGRASVLLHSLPDATRFGRVPLVATKGSSSPACGCAQTRLSASHAKWLPSTSLGVPAVQVAQAAQRPARLSLKPSHSCWLVRSAAISPWAEGSVAACLLLLLWQAAGAGSAGVGATRGAQSCRALSVACS